MNLLQQIQQRFEDSGHKNSAKISGDEWTEIRALIASGREAIEQNEGLRSDLTGATQLAENYRSQRNEIMADRDRLAAEREGLLGTIEMLHITRERLLAEIGALKADVEGLGGSLRDAISGRAGMQATVDQQRATIERLSARALASHWDFNICRSLERGVSL